MYEIRAWLWTGTGLSGLIICKMLYKRDEKQKMNINNSVSICQRWMLTCEPTSTLDYVMNRVEWTTTAAHHFDPNFTKSPIFLWLAAWKMALIIIKGRNKKEEGSYDFRLPHNVLQIALLQPIRRQYRRDVKPSIKVCARCFSSHFWQ